MDGLEDYVLSGLCGTDVYWAKYVCLLNEPFVLIYKMTNQIRKNIPQQIIHPLHDSAT